MNATTITLPAPANGDVRYSITSLADLLCVPAAAVALEVGPYDIHSDRMFATYVGVDGDPYGDCWLEGEAAERIAAELPTGLLARRVAAGDLTDAARLGPDQVLDIARHLVDQFGGAA